MSTHSRLGLSVLLPAVLLALVFAVLLFFQQQEGGGSGGGDIIPQRKKKMVLFSSAEDFREYLAEAEDVRGGGFGFGFRNDVAVLESAQPLSFPSSDRLGVSFGGGEENGARYSQTNVRTTGVDEPDIVKTDGKWIYLAHRVRGKEYVPDSQGAAPREGVPFPEIEVLQEEIGIAPRIFPPRYFYQNQVSLIKPSPPSAMEIKASLAESLPSGGSILVRNNTLLTVNQRNVKAFDISQPGEPFEKMWEFQASEGTYIDTVRMNEGNLYVMARTRIEQGDPCPITPLQWGQGRETVIPCSRIYHPVVSVPVEEVFSLFIVRISDGEELASLSFAGESRNVVYYMTPENIYLTYEEQKNVLDVLKDFLQSHPSVFPEEVRIKIIRVIGYPISSRAKMVEVGEIMGRYLKSLGDDERLQFEAESKNAWRAYMEKNKKSLQSTAIMQINAKDLSIQKTGSVPGRLLNEFSIDEFEGYVRVASTVRPSLPLSGFGMPSIDSESGVYVLDSDLNIVGTVEGLGKGERIYAVRFADNRAFVVTFREIDPFYIIDLSDPMRPYQAGELKIPGYSSYLHPLSDTLVAGIGKEGNSVKVSLFDVSDSFQPVERGKYALPSAFWSDILNTHRAFLNDKKYQVFFVPAGQGGYFFSYKNGVLSLEATISIQNPKRALFVGDYMYVVGENEIVSVKEGTWKRVGSLVLDSGIPEAVPRAEDESGVLEEN